MDIACCCEDFSDPLLGIISHIRSSTFHNLLTNDDSSRNRHFLHSTTSDLQNNL